MHCPERSTQIKKTSYDHCFDRRAKQPEANKAIGDRKRRHLFLVNRLVVADVCRACWQVAAKGILRYRGRVALSPFINRMVETES